MAYLWRLPDRGVNKNEIIPWASRNPRTKAEIYSVKDTERQILEDKVSGLPQVITALAIGAGIVTYQIKDPRVIEFIGNVLELPLQEMSSMQLALSTAGFILVGGSLALLAWYAQKIIAIDQMTARAIMDIENQLKYVENMEAERHSPYF